jgi:uncharacterized protein (TIGR02301 family)
MIRLARAFAVAALLAAAPAGAQTATPPVEADLMRFSEILGAVAYLDALCGSSDAAVWRGRMQALIAAQQMTPEDRRRYVDAYNRGHRTFASVHRACTERTRLVLEAYFAEGTEIAVRIDERFGRGPSPPPATAVAPQPRLPAD